MPPLTWVSDIASVLQTGFTPVFVDVDLNTLGMTTEGIIKAITPNTKAVFLSHIQGFNALTNELLTELSKRNIPLIEDVCESHGATHNRQLLGSFGWMSNFSFYYAHHMSTIEGGMVCTDDPDLGDMLKMVRANGWDRNLAAQKQKELRTAHSVPSEFEAKYAFYELGFNFRPTEITGFLGNTQLAYLPENIQKREQNHIFFESLIGRNRELRVIQRSHLSRCSAFCLPILCARKEIKEKYKRKFGDSGIEIRPMIAGNIQNQPFYRRYQTKAFELPGTTEIDECGFYCGNYPELDDADLQCIASCLL